MSKNGLKIKVVVMVVALLGTAMLLQSMVLVFLGVRSSVSQHIESIAQKGAFAASYIANSDNNTSTDIQALEKLKLALLPERCIVISLSAHEFKGQGEGCRFSSEIGRLSLEAQRSGELAVRFSGAVWTLFMYRSEVAIISIPLVSSAGVTFGAVTIERSLLPIYQRYQAEMNIAYFYLAINALVLGAIFFFRMTRLVFRPVDRLVEMAENYSPDVQPMFPMGKDDGAFRKLSLSLNGMFHRIEEDNKKLRAMVDALERANKDLKEKNDLVIRSEKLASVGRLSAGLAHEIGNPLSIIQGYVDLLKGAELDSNEKIDFSEKATQELDRIKRLISQLLDYSRSKSAPYEIVHVNALIDEVVKLVSLEKSIANCNISSELRTETDTVLADANALRQVLLNCLLNAADATEHNQARAREIHISSRPVERGKGLESYLSVIIEDNGEGIAEPNLNYVFDPFFTTKSVGKGTGLGLFVCHSIIDSMGGTISISNKESGRGAKVCIFLPVAAAK